MVPGETAFTMNQQMKKMTNIKKIIITLFLIIVSIPSIPGASAKSEETILYSNPSQGPVGTTVQIEGVCFTPSVLAGITSNVTRISQAQIFFPDRNSLCKTEVIDTWGKLNTTIVVDELPAGTYQIWVHDVTAGPFAWVSVPFTIEPKIEPSKHSGYVGDVITIYGNGFMASSSISLYMGNKSIGIFYSDEQGSFSNKTFIVPDLTNNEYSIRAVDRQGNDATISFTSQRQKLVIFPNASGPGKEINLMGTGFAPAKNITLKVYNTGTIIPNVTTIPETVTTDISGSFDAYLIIPACVSDNYIIEAFDGDVRAGATLAVSSSGVFDRNIGFIGSNVTFSGNGFLPYRYTMAHFNGIPLAEAKADQNGGSSFSFVIPPCKPGEHVITVSDGVSSYSYTFSVLPKAKVQINRTISTIGSEIILTGAGFIPDKVVMISIDGDTITEIYVNDDESFTTSFPVPVCSPGVKVISVTDGINIVELTLNVESQVLPSVSPVTPDNYSSYEPSIILIWEPLPDFTGVSYHVQIAGDLTFSPDSLIIQREGITEIQYIFNMEPVIQSGSNSDSFFWRVRAERNDAVSAGEWSEPRKFLMSVPVIAEAGSENFLVSYGLLLELGTLVLLLVYWIIKKKRKSSRVSVSVET